MFIHRNKSIQYILTVSIIALITFACTFVTGNTPGAAPTEVVPPTASHACSNPGPALSQFSALGQRFDIKERDRH
jgi:hypothetical protein